METQRINPVFIGHGSPMNAIEDNRYSAFLRDYALSIARPSAIVVVSAHWQTDGTRITGAETPEQMYDFYGFPDELYSLVYAPRGDPALARSIAEEFREIRVDETRGIDHAGWAVARHMYPQHDIPLLELSLDYNKSEREHYEFGKRLAALSDRGILVMGSGNAVHNLRNVSFDSEARAFPWAIEADAWIASRIADGNAGELIEYRTCMPGWKQAVPTDEHFLPLLYILAMNGPGRTAHTLYEEIQNGSISMRSFEIL